MGPVDLVGLVGPVDPMGPVGPVGPVGLDIRVRLVDLVVDTRAAVIRGSPARRDGRGPGGRGPVSRGPGRRRLVLWRFLGGI